MITSGLELVPGNRDSSDPRTTASGAHVGLLLSWRQHRDDSADGFDERLNGVALRVHLLQDPQLAGRVIARQRRPVEHPVESGAAVVIVAAAIAGVCR